MSIVTNWKKTKRPKDLNCQLSMKGLPTGILIHIYTYIWKEIPCPRIIKLTVFLIDCTQFVCVEDLKRNSAFSLYDYYGHTLSQESIPDVEVYEIYNLCYKQISCHFLTKIQTKPMLISNIFNQGKHVYIYIYSVYIVKI